MKRLAVLVLIATTLLMTGCMRQELENRAIIVTMGLDLTHDNRIKLSIQVGTAKQKQNESESSGEGKGSDESGLISAEGDDWVTAVTALRAASSHILNFTQLRLIVVSNKLAEQPHFMKTLAEIYEFPQMRSSTYVVVTLGEATDFIQKNKPDIEISLSKYVDIAIENTIAKGYIPHNTIGEVLRDSHSAGDKGLAPVLMLGAVVDTGPQHENEPTNPHDILPNKLSGGAEPKARLLGAAVTNGDMVVGYLTGYEMQLLSLLQGTVESIYCKTGYGPVILKSKNRTKLSVRSGEPSVVVANVSLYSYASAGQMNDCVEVEKIIRNDLVKLINKLQSMKSDAIGFGYCMVKRFWTIADWEAYDWVAHFEQAQVEVGIEVTPMVSILS